MQTPSPKKKETEEPNKNVEYIELSFLVHPEPNNTHDGDAKAGNRSKQNQYVSIVIVDTESEELNG